jgi:hypothetical protein
LGRQVDARTLQIARPFFARFRHERIFNIFSLKQLIFEVINLKMPMNQLYGRLMKRRAFYTFDIFKNSDVQEADEDERYHHNIH